MYIYAYMYIFSFFKLNWIGLSVGDCGMWRSRATKKKKKQKQKVKKTEKKKRKKKEKNKESYLESKDDGKSNGFSRACNAISLFFFIWPNSLKRYSFFG